MGGLEGHLTGLGVEGRFDPVPVVDAVGVYLRYVRGDAVEGHDDLDLLLEGRDRVSSHGGGEVEGFGGLSDVGGDVLAALGHSQSEGGLGAEGLLGHGDLGLEVGLVVHGDGHGGISEDVPCVLLDVHLAAAGGDGHGLALDALLRVLLDGTGDGGRHGGGVGTRSGYVDGDGTAGYGGLGLVGSRGFSVGGRLVFLERRGLRTIVVLDDGLGLSDGPVVVLGGRLDGLGLHGGTRLFHDHGDLDVHGTGGDSVRFSHRKFGIVVIDV